MSRLLSIASCSLNQWSLDYEGNTNRIIASIREAKRRGCKVRVGPELEISGYGCQDHFLEDDTVLHCWEMLLRILKAEDTTDILIDVGMPVIHRGVRYNSRVVLWNREIKLIRPKVYMANDGNYRELRWFTPWPIKKWELFHLPSFVTASTGQLSCVIGDVILEARDTSLGWEMCEELFTPRAPHLELSLEGVEVILNSSASHHELRKLQHRVQLITAATKKCGGVYVYANQHGCDGDRLYYDGAPMIILNGAILSQGLQFTLDDVHLITATMDLQRVITFRGYSVSRNLQASNQPHNYHRIQLDAALTCTKGTLSKEVEPVYCNAEEEISKGPAGWLWDYLRKSGAPGYFLPLSGGLDSCSTALLVYSMCRMVFQAMATNEQVKADVARILKGREVKDARDLCGKLFYTCYMATEYSSDETRTRAKDLAEAIGSYHVNVDMDPMVKAMQQSFEATMNCQRSLDFAIPVENLALQNIQARLRMVTGYMYAQLLPSFTSANGGGNLLVLGSANVDECLRGYFTKYDCSSADLNPIGSISKVDLGRFVQWAQRAFSLPILQKFIEATPSAELIPGTEQKDEEEMGFSYSELSLFGRLRKVERLGPVSMSQRLEGSEDQVKRFFYYYGRNRHKMTTLTPAYHCEAYSPDDHRFDLRPFLYPINEKWWPFLQIDRSKEKAVNKS